MEGSGIVRLHASLVRLVCVNFCLTKKEKKNCCRSRKLFPLQMKCFLIFAKVFYSKIRPKNYYSRKFLSKNSRFFDLVKVSVPKVPLVDFTHILTDFYHLPVSLVLFTHSPIDACEFAQVGLNKFS